MFIINRCFKNIWLESQMIHVALFSFQRTTLSSKRFASSDFYILSHRAELVKKFFLSFFNLDRILFADLTAVLNFLTALIAFLTLFLDQFHVADAPFQIALPIDDSPLPTALQKADQPFWKNEVEQIATVAAVKAIKA